MQDKNPLVHCQKKCEALDQRQEDRDTEFDQYNKDQTSHVTQMATKNAELETEISEVKMKNAELGTTEISELQTKAQQSTMQQRILKLQLEFVDMLDKLKEKECAKIDQKFWW